MKLFFVGIGGIGASGLAQLCQSLGDQVVGSNQGRTEVFEILENTHIPCFDVHDGALITPELEAVIYSEAVPETNPERMKAVELGIPQYSYFEFLGKISEKFRVIAVAGTHGKTTTTGMLCAGLKSAGIEFTALVGATLPEFEGCNFYTTAGESKFLIVEACEYRNNFQFLNPEIVLLTNAELDHVDFYRDEAHYIETFQDFCKDAKVVLYHEEDQGALSVLETFKGQKFPLPKTLLSQIKLSVSGHHNRSNAGLALGTATYLSFEGIPVDMGKFKQGLESFVGAGRRQELIGSFESLEIYDDYGHHPTEIKATLQALKEKHPEEKIGLIFEPHQYSRTREFFDDFVQVLGDIPAVGIYPIYEARDTEEDKEAVSHCDLASALKASVIEKFEDIDQFIDQNDLQVLIFMGAGDISEVAHDFLRKKTIT